MEVCRHSFQHTQPQSTNYTAYTCPTCSRAVCSAIKNRPVISGHRHQILMDNQRPRGGSTAFIQAEISQQLLDGLP